MANAVADPLVKEGVNRPSYSGFPVSTSIFVICVSHVLRKYTIQKKKCFKEI